MQENTKYSFKASFHESLGLSVYYCGFEQCSPSHFWGPALRDHYLIHFIAEGAGKFTCRSKTYYLSEGDGFFVEPGEMAFYQADNENPWKYYWVGFSGIDASRLIGAAGISSSSPIFKCDNIPETISLFKSIYNSKGNNLHNELSMTAGLYDLFAKLIKNSNMPDGRKQQNRNYVEMAIKFVEHNFSRPISVTDIADNAGISRSHLYRLFVQQIGMTPNEYLVKYRIDIACKLLSENRINISEAACSSGFSDPLYFSRVFKKIKKVTPTEYIKSN